MKKKTFIIILIIIVALVLIKIIFLTKDEDKAKGGPQKGPEGSFPVRVHVAKEEILKNNITSTGTIMANEEIELRAEVPGPVRKIYFKEGTPVKKGTLLVKINDAEMQAQLKKMQLQQQLAEQKVERYKKMSEIQGISREEYDIIINQANTLNADIEFTRAQIAKTEIRAPFDGVIGLKNVSEGSYVNAMQVIAVLQQTDPVKIEFFIPERYSAFASTSNSINFFIEGLRDTFTGKVYAIEPKIDPVTRTIRLRAVSENKDGRINPGSFAKVSLTLNEIKDALLIPTEAIIPELKGQKVFLYRSGKAQPQKVETGLRTESRIQIFKGIEPGDTIITMGIMQLKPGVAVKIAEK